MQREKKTDSLDEETERKNDRKLEVQWQREGQTYREAVADKETERDAHIKTLRNRKKERQRERERERKRDKCKERQNYIYFSG